MRKYSFAALMILVTGCSGHIPLLQQDAGPSFSASADIDAALNNANINCGDYAAAPKDHRDLAEMGSADDVGKCDLDGETVHLITFKDKGQLENWAGTYKQLGCGIGQMFGVANLNYVSGANWAVSDVSETLAGKISAAIGGKSTHIDCSDVKLPGN